jgi:cation:H+ antiporter
MTIWLQFAACTVIILLAGTQLSKYGDVIAEKTGLGRTWIGVVLMASVTSLPELMTGLSSVTFFDLPNIAAGDVLGSCMFNILILALLDFRRGTLPLSTQAQQGQVLSAGFGILLLGVTCLSIAAGPKLPVLGWVGLYSPLLLLVYLLAMRLVFLYERRRRTEYIGERADELQHEDISRARAFGLYALNAVFVIGAALWLPGLGEKIADLTGLGRTFVGSLFIALSTSLPEIVVSVAALRMGAVDLALGNLFGSNLFNLGILALDDLFYTKGSLLALISPNHLITASGAVMMTAIAVIGLTYRATRKSFAIFGWDAVAILAIYGMAISVLYLLR